VGDANAAEVVFAMSKAPKNDDAVAVKIGTGQNYPAVQASATEHHQDRPDRDLHKEQLRRSWEELERRRQELTAFWPEDITQPSGIPVCSAIDWTQQPAIPAEKIDWSKQGEPLRVKPTLGTMVAVISLIISILGGGAYFYWGVNSHIKNQQVHLPADGVPWGVKASYQTREDAARQHEKLHKEIVSEVKESNRKLRVDVIRAIKKVSR